MPKNPTDSVSDYSLVSKLDTFQKILDQSLDVICTIDKNGRFIWLNQASERMWGYSPDELTGIDFMSLVLEADRYVTRQVASAIVSGTDHTNFENRYIHKNGSEIPVVWSATWNKSEEIMYCIVRDAREKLKAEGLVIQREKLLRNAMKMARMGTWEYDAVAKKTSCSDEIFEIFGLSSSPNNIDLSALIMDLVHPDDMPLLQSQFENVDLLSLSFTHRLVRPDQKTIYVQQTITKQINHVGKVIHISGIAQDITEQMVHEQHLKASEKRLKGLVENGHDLIAIIDIAGNYLYVGGNVHHILGYEPEYFTGKNAFDFIHPDDGLKVYEKLPAMTDKKIVDFPPFRFRAANGEWRWIESTITNRLNDSDINGLVVNSWDITDKKGDQDIISMLSKIAEQTPNAVLITDLNEKITWVNPAFQKITGYSLTDAMGENPGKLLQGPDSSIETKALMKQRIALRMPFEVEIINYSKDKRPYWTSIQCQPQTNESGVVNGFFTIQTDITERKRLQAQLNQEIEQRQKKVTAAMVKAQEKERNEIGKELHDNVNQVLSTVKLYLGILKEPSLQKEDLVDKSIHYLQDCIDEIRKISKRLSCPTGELNLEEAIKELIDSIAVAATINFEYYPQNLIDCKPHDDIKLAIYRIVQEHLTNILKHANADQVIISLRCQSDIIQLHVVDNGQGFDVGKKRKGIGLSNIYNRAQAVGGQIEINSTVGEGCLLMGKFPLREYSKQVNTAS